MASTVLGAASTVTAVFGMNLGLPLAMAALPSSAAYFWGVLAGLVGGMAASFGALLLWGRAAGLLPRAPHGRSPWLLDALWAMGGGAAVAAAAGGGGAPGDARPPSSARSRSWPPGTRAETGTGEMPSSAEGVVGASEDWLDAWLDEPPQQGKEGVKGQERVRGGAKEAGGVG